MEFKFRLRDLRRESGMTAEQLGALVGVSRYSISHFESGRNEPSLEVCHKFCEVFKCSMDYLLGFSNQKISSERLTDDEIDMLYHFRCLSDEDKRMITKLIAFLESEKK